MTKHDVEASGDGDACVSAFGLVQERHHEALVMDEKKWNWKEARWEKRAIGAPNA